MPGPRGAAGVRLSASPVWPAQRRYYARAGIDAWRTGTIPHHVTSNVAMATAYARIVLGFARDRPGPIHILELGAGSGRFAFLFLRALETLAGRAAARVRYVMTDVADRTIDFWRRQPELARFHDAGRLDFARFDAESDAVLRLRGERRTEEPGAPVPRLVVIANYVLGGLPQDAFTMRAGRLHEYLVAASLPAAADPAAVSLTWRVGPSVAAPYDDPELDRVLRHHARGVRSGPLLFPVGALRCLHRLAALARDDMLVLVADRPSDVTRAARGAADLGMGRHGAISFPLSFPALRRWANGRGGQRLHAGRPRHVQVEALVVGSPGRWPGTRAAFAAAMAHGGPDRVYALRRALSTAAAPRAHAVLEVMRRCGPDPRVVAECLRPLWPHLADPDPRLRAEIATAVLAAWPNAYHLGDAHDLAFDLGLLLYQVRAYREAAALFEASLRRYGDDAATHWNLGLCHVALGRAHAARAAFQRVRRLAPAFRAGGPATLKIGGASPRVRAPRRAPGALPRRPR